MEQGYHGSLEGGTGIVQTEWHNVVGISSLMSGECYLGFVFFGHFDLIITLESIQKGEEHVGWGVIDQGIDIWQWKIVLRFNCFSTSSLIFRIIFDFILRRACHTWRALRFNRNSVDDNLCI